MSKETQKRYLIWLEGNDAFLDDGMEGEVVYWAAVGSEVWMDQVKQPVNIENARIVTLAEAPTPSEVRELLAMPDPLEECLGALFALGNEVDSFTFRVNSGMEEVSRYQALKPIQSDLLRRANDVQALLAKARAIVKKHGVSA